MVSCHKAKIKDDCCNLALSTWLFLGIFETIIENSCLIGYKSLAIISTSFSTPTTSSLPQLPSPLLSSYLLYYNMPMNQPTQNQAWIWNPTMDSHQSYFQLEQEQKGRQRREQMFEKPLTPSDVGKLNRLVIPKQHAEKYFPVDSESGEKGLLLSFEDEMGKLWKFRYSYWTSSQSYVLTKGWSRFVKEKMLDAGDIVVFERCHLGSLYIACRRRGSIDASTTTAASAPTLYEAPSAYPTPYYYMNSVSSGENAARVVENTTAVATTKRLRLFGVNLECPVPQHLVSDSWRSQFMPTNASTSQL